MVKLGNLPSRNILEIKYGQRTLDYMSPGFLNMLPTKI